MAERSDDRKSTPAVRPPPLRPEDEPAPVSVPPLEPPPSSLGPLAGRRAPRARGPRGFWLVLVALFLAGTFVTFYLQR